MAIGGETVGSAYVRILADGTGLDQSVADEFDRVDARSHGEKAGKDYSDGVERGLKKNRPKSQKAVNELFSQDSARIKVLTKEMEGNFYKNLEKRVRARNAGNEALGDRVMRSINKGFIKGGGYAQWGENLEKLFGQLPNIEEKALADMARQEQKFADEQSKAAKFREAAVIAAGKRRSDAYKQELAEEERLSKQRENAEIAAGKRRGDAYKRMIDEAYKMNREFHETRIRDIGREQRSIEVLARAESAAYKERERTFHKAADEIRHTFDRIQKGQSDSGETIRESMDKTIHKIRDLHGELRRNPGFFGDKEDHDEAEKFLRRMEVGLTRVTPRFRRLNGALDDLSPRIGRAFGRGSRNDFINFTGGAIEGVSRLAFAVPKLAEKVFSLGGTFNGLRKSDGILKALGGTFSGAAGGGSKFLSSLAAMGVAIPIVVAVVGAMVAVFSLLLGVITALASTISFALVGGLAVLAGAILPVIAGLGAVGIAIASMDDKTKKLVKSAIKPLGAEFKRLGQIGADHLFRDIGDQISTVTNAIKKSPMDVLIRRISAAMRDVGTSIADSIDSPGFRKFIATMSRSLPGQIKSLGEIIKNTFGGLGGIFIALQPFVTRFLDSFERMTKRFSDWANSATGQNEIADFMDKAFESAKALGDFLGELGGLLGDLLFNSTGKDAGDSMFKGMADAIARFRDYIKDGKLEKWFKDAKKFGDDLGGALKKLAKFVDDLDDSTSRFLASDAIKFIGWVADLAGFLVKHTPNLYTFAKAVTNIGDAFSGIAGVVSSVIESVVAGVGNFIGFILNRIGDLFSALGDVGGLLGRLPGVPDGLGKSAQAAADKFHTLGDAASDLTVKVGKIPKKAEVKAGDNGTMSFLGQTAKALEKGINDIPKNPKIKPSDSGLFKGLTGLARNLEKGIDDIPKNPKVKVGESGFDKVGDAAARLRKLILAIPTYRKVTVETNSVGKRISGRTNSASGGVFFDDTKLKKYAFGGMANYAQRAYIGESGREAVVPLDRPLGQVDPAVRALSAFAQGKSFGDTTNSRTVDASGWIIQSPNDSGTVAREVVDALAAKII